MGNLLTFNLLINQLINTLILLYLMKTKRQQLIETTETYSNEEHVMECSFSNHINNFCIHFNGQLWSYKTYNGYVNKRNYFIEKYNLIKL